jgi:hypothetical protein
MRTVATYEVEGFYGTRNRGTIFVAETSNGGKWYCVEGSCNVNFTYDAIQRGTNVESLRDSDTMSSTSGIDSLDELENFINE